MQTVSGASWAADVVAADGLASVFGVPLATQVRATQDTNPYTPDVQLPLLLAGTSLRLRDSQGVERTAPLLFVSPTQINFLVPRATAAGTATVFITHGGDGAVAIGSVVINAVGPALFTADASGKELAAAEVIRVKADGSQITESIARYDSALNRFVPVPIDFGAATDQMFLTLYGTGWRGRSQLSAVTVTMGGTSAEVTYAGAQGGFVGLDQLNVRLPRSLKGKGEVTVSLQVEGHPANPVQVWLK